MGKKSGAPKQKRTTKKTFITKKPAYERLEIKNRIASIPLLRDDIDFRFDTISGYPTIKDKTSTNSRLKKFQDQIYIETFGNALRKRNIQDKEHLIAVIVGNLVRGYVAGRNISVSLDIAILKKIELSKAGINISHNSRYIDNRTIPVAFVDIIHCMESHNHINLKLGHRSLVTGEGNLSTISAKGELLAVISEVVESKPIEKLIRTIQDECIRLNSDFDIVKGRGKSATPDTIKGLIDYNDNSFTNQLREETLLINKTMAKNVYTFGKSQIFYTPLYRVFNNDFNSSGRYYGGFHQKMSRYERLNIFIDDSPVAEVDYQCCGVNIFYNAILGIQSPQYVDSTADHYTLSDQELNQIGIIASKLEKRHYDAIRQLNKDIMLRMPNVEVSTETDNLLVSINGSLKSDFNSETEKAYINRLLEVTKNVNSQKIKISSSSDLARIQSLVLPMIMAMEIKHKILFDYVRDNGVQWAKIQAVDSDIITKILLYIANNTIMKRDGTEDAPRKDDFSYFTDSTPALPIHDSLLVKKHHAQAVKKIMVSFYKYKCGHDISVKVKQNDHSADYLDGQMDLYSSIIAKKPRYAKKQIDPFGDIEGSESYNTRKEVQGKLAQLDETTKSILKHHKFLYGDGLRHRALVDTIMAVKHCQKRTASTIIKNFVDMRLVEPLGNQKDRTYRLLPLVAGELRTY